MGHWCGLTLVGLWVRLWAWLRVWYGVGPYDGLGSKGGCLATLVYYLLFWVLPTLTTYIVGEVDTIILSLDYKKVWNICDTLLWFLYIIGLVAVRTRLTFCWAGDLTEIFASGSICVNGKTETEYIKFGPRNLEAGSVWECIISD